MIPSVVAGTLARSVEDFLRATFPVSTPAMTGLLDGLFAPGGMFKGPYLSINLPDRLAEDGAEPFTAVPLGYHPYRHQQAAFERLGGPDRDLTWSCKNMAKCAHRLLTTRNSLLWISFCSPRGRQEGRTYRAFPPLPTPTVGLRRGVDVKLGLLKT